MKDRKWLIGIILAVVVAIAGIYIYIENYKPITVETKIKSYPIEDVVKTYDFGADYGVEFIHFEKDNSEIGYLNNTFVEQDDSFLFLDVEFESKVQFKGNKSRDYILDTDIPLDFGQGFEKIIDYRIVKFEVKRLNLRTGEVSFVKDLKDTVETELANYPSASINNIVLGYQSNNDLTVDIQLVNKEWALSERGNSSDRSNDLVRIKSNEDDNFGTFEIQIIEEGTPIGKQKKGFLSGTQLENDNILYTRNGNSVIWQRLTLSDVAFGHDANYWLFIVKSIENSSYNYYVDIAVTEGNKDIKETKYNDLTHKIYSGSSVRIYFNSIENIGDIVEIFQYEPVDYSKVRIDFWGESEKEEINKKLDDGEIIIGTYEDLENFFKEFYIESDEFVGHW